MIYIWVKLTSSSHGTKILFEQNMSAWYILPLALAIFGIPQMVLSFYEFSADFPYPRIIRMVFWGFLMTNIVGSWTIFWGSAYRNQKYFYELIHDSEIPESHPYYTFGNILVKIVMFVIMFVLTTDIAYTIFRVI
ncbi:MAG: hypothetical protein F6J87_26645 [Spirulina sp. SIO3F2]|nr:hypothetical protein [Spirulina sp. SIO3F2]